GQNAADTAPVQISADNSDGQNATDIAPLQISADNSDGQNATDTAPVQISADNSDGQNATDTAPVQISADNSNGQAKLVGEIGYDYAVALSRLAVDVIGKDLTLLIDLNGNDAYQEVCTLVGVGNQTVSALHDNDCFIL
ncbi:hypothetical protein J7481_05740, partial [Labrenzia sp. R4_2]|nr:hypothetical protein [Labrenzia sp. R4_2]